MSQAITIQKVVAREVLDSRGFPTVECELVVLDPKHPSELISARAIVPSGASTGEGEALELRDGDNKRYGGKGVQKAVTHVRTQIAPAIEGKTFKSQNELDALLLKLDGTENKSKLGANAILAVSMAYCRAQSLTERKPTYQVIAQNFGTSGVTIPVPMMNILNGGKHADNGLDVQEFMIVPVGFNKFSEALRAGSEIFHTLKKQLHKAGLSTGVGDEGGFAPVLPGERPHTQVIEAILTAIKAAGYEPGKDVFLALDAAASEFGKKDASGKVMYTFEGRSLTNDEMIQIYGDWMKKYPIISIEDGFAEHDWEGWMKFTAQYGKQVQIVGDDLFVTNPVFLKQGIEKKAANSILIKLNQIGSVTETLDAMKMAKEARFAQVTSHRSGETEDTFIAHLAVGTDCGQIKTGSLARTDRLCKYNELLRIEEELGSKAKYLGIAAFKR